jgi:ATP-binding cassette subfamily B protein
MRKYFQDKFAMSEKGAKNLIISIVWSAIMDLSFMFPVILGFQFLDEHLGTLLNASNTPKKQCPLLCDYSCSRFAGQVYNCLFPVRLDLYPDLRGKRPTGVSVSLNAARSCRLRSLQKGLLPTLSATIMEDATQIEQRFPCGSPNFAAAVTIFIMGVMMFIYNWRLSLAVFWVVPVALWSSICREMFQNRMHTPALSRQTGYLGDNIQEGFDSSMKSSPTFGKKTIRIPKHKAGPLREVFDLKEKCCSAH